MSSKIDSLPTVFFSFLEHDKPYNYADLHRENNKVKASIGYLFLYQSRKQLRSDDEV